VAKARAHVKEGLTAVTPFLAVPDIPTAIAWYVRVFGAVDVRRDPGPDGVVQHAVLRIDDAPIELGRHATTAPTGSSLPSVTLHLYVADVDGVWERARADGATGYAPIAQPYGDREAMVVDPFGITWFVATNQS
jgi:PhnB protein